MSYRSYFKNCKHFAEKFLLLSKEFEEEKDTVKRRVSSARLHKTGRNLERALFNFDKEHKREKQKRRHMVTASSQNVEVQS